MLQAPQAKLVAGVIARCLEPGGRALVAVAVRDRVRLRFRGLGSIVPCYTTQFLGPGGRALVSDIRCWWLLGRCW